MDADQGYCGGTNVLEHATSGLVATRELQAPMPPQ